MARRHAVTAQIDEAVALLEKYGTPITLDAVRVNVKKRLTWADFSSDEALDAVVDKFLRPRLKQLGYIITDTEDRDRELREDCTRAQFSEQLRIKRENLIHVSNWVRAEDAVEEFLRVKESMLGRPVTVGEFGFEVEGIYAAHDLTVRIPHAERDVAA